MKSSAHATFELKYHLVLVTKYRHKVLTAEMLEHLREHFAELLVSWRCELIEFGGEPDHVHLLFEAHPALEMAGLVNNLKTASARKLKKPFAEHLKPFYCKPGFWHRAYYLGSVGNASLETVKRYVEQQRGAARPAA
jgi:putative transposase